MPENQHINFLSIDVEGLDFEVLESNSWSKYRPDIILVEAIGSTIESLLQSDTRKLLNKEGYSMFSKAVHTVFFRRNEFKV